MAIATYSGLTAEQRTLYELVMLRRAVAPFIYLAFGQQGIHPQTKVPENKGTAVQWRKMAALSSVTTPLADGVTPDSHDISISTVGGTVYEYGAYVRYSRSLAQFGIDKVAAEASDALGEQAGDSLDLITRAGMVAGTTIQYASTATGTTTVASTMLFTAAEALEALATLKTNKAVAPLGSGMFPCVVHPYTEYDAFTDPTWQAVLSYTKERGDRNPWVSGYIGDAFGLSYYVTPNAYVESSAGAGSIDVYHSLILGKSSFGIGGLGSYMPDVMKAQQNGNNTFQNVRPLRLIDKPFGSAGTSDPLDQRATIAWYTTYCTKILDENFMLRIEHATSLG